MLFRAVLPQIVASAIMSLSVSVSGQSQLGFDNYERILIPISVQAASGAFGTRWQTELWYRNNSSFGVSVFPLAVGDRVPTIGVTEQLPIGVMPADRPGQFLYVTREFAEDVQFSLRIYDEATLSRSWGAQLPIARELDFREGALNLINVPIDNTSRAALRIYGFSNDHTVPQTEVEVRVYGLEDKPVGSMVLPFDEPVASEYIPRYASIIALQDAFIRGTANSIRGPFRVEVLPPAGVSIWAFISITSNTTQDISIIAPH